MPPSSPPQILKVVPVGATPLTPSQKKFNTLVQRIARYREVLSHWAAARTAFMQRYTLEFEPLKEEKQSLQTAMLHLLHNAGERVTQPADRQLLSELICRMAKEMLDVVDPFDDAALFEEVQGLLQLHAGTRHTPVPTRSASAAWQRAAGRQPSMMLAVVQEMFGVELSAQDLATPETLMQRLHTALANKCVEEAVLPQQSLARAQALALQAADKLARKKISARDAKKREEALQISHAVRGIYRRLHASLALKASTDTATRTRYAQLKQRVEGAYQEGNLLQLLELQLETEQIDPALVAQFSETRLQRYNALLTDQLKDLQLEVRLREQGILMEFQLPLQDKIRPRRLGKLLQDEIGLLYSENQKLQALVLRLCEEPGAIHLWLAQERAARSSLPHSPGHAALPQDSE